MNHKASPSPAVWTKMSTSIPVRDKSVKVIQYGAKMLLSFYGNTLSNDTTIALATLQHICTTSRKSFRLFKSFNHISNIIRLLDQSSFQTIEESVLHVIDILEQISWAFFFYYDNKALISLTRLIAYHPTKDLPRFYTAWMSADIFFFFGSLLRFRMFLEEKMELMEKIKLLQNSLILNDTTTSSNNDIPNNNNNACVTDNINNNNDITTATTTGANVSQEEVDNKKYNNNIIKTTPSPSTTGNTTTGNTENSVESDLKRYQMQLQLMDLKLNDQYWFLFKGICNILVSSNNQPLGLSQRIFGKPLPDSFTGLIGMISAAMIVYENWPNEETAGK